MEIIKDTFADLFKKGIKIHVIFLAGLFLITTCITLQRFNSKAVIPRAVLVYVLIICCIYTGRWLAQQFLIKNRWIYLILLIGAAVVLFSAIGIFAMVNLLSRPDGSDLSDLVVVVPLLVTLALFAGGMVATTRLVLRQQVNELKILHQQSATELSLLTSRLSPHFLFNTLNNLYGLSIYEHQRVPDLLLKLSDLLSYSLYSSDEPLVKLQNEVTYIRNFIDMEKIRVSDRLVLDVAIDDLDPTLKIAPMVLIIFVENAFKHAKNTLDNKIYISIRLWTTAQSIHFSIENSCTDKPVELSGHKTSGLGISTTIKRLELLYGDKYQLHYGNKKDSYHVNLEIPNYEKP